MTSEYVKTRAERYGEFEQAKFERKYALSGGFLIEPHGGKGLNFERLESCAVQVGNHFVRRVLSQTETGILKALQSRQRMPTSDVARCLNGLPPEVIAQLMYDKGCVGRIRDPYRCVLSNFITGLSNEPSIYVGNGIYQWGTNVIYMSDPVREFVDRFDKLLYPKLVL